MILLLDIVCGPVLGGNDVLEFFLPRPFLKMNQHLNWEQAPTQQQATQELRNFIAKMNKIYREIQTPKTEQ